MSLPVKTKSYYHGRVSYPRLKTILRLLLISSVKVETSLEALKQNIETKSGAALLDFIVEHIQQIKRSADPQSLNVIRGCDGCVLLVE